MSPARAMLLISISAVLASAADRGGTHVLPVVDRQDIRFTTDTSEGEPLNKWITGIVQDDQGFMWFATQDGLFRYDGYEIVPYLHDPQNPNSLSSDLIRAIYKGPNGMLWIGTRDTGLEQLDPARGVFTHYRHQPGYDPEALASYVARLQYDTTAKQSSALPPRDERVAALRAAIQQHPGNAFSAMQEELHRLLPSLNSTPLVK